MRFQISFKVISFLIAILLSASFATAQDKLEKPYTFYPYTSASAGEVNANFDVLYEKINELSAEIAELKSNTASDVIYCSKSGSLNGGAGSYSISFSASDCGGTLPDDSYIGAANRIDVSCGIIVFNIVDGPAPGVSFYSENGPCGGYAMQVLYIKAHN